VRGVGHGIGLANNHVTQGPVPAQPRKFAHRTADRHPHFVTLGRTPCVARCANSTLLHSENPRALRSPCPASAHTILSTMILTCHHNINISPRVADACAGTSFKKCTIPWKGADRMLRIHSAMDEHYLEDLDLTDPEHWKYLSWGRLIMPFECAILPVETQSGMGPMQSYAFIEEYWPYDHTADDVLCR